MWPSSEWEGCEDGWGGGGGGEEGSEGGWREGGGEGEWTGSDSGRSLEMEFALPPACFATSLLRELLKSRL